ncbi:MAG: DUF2293 domain-containing protein [Cyanobacteria bacterium]|nr:DUF2293 domain-containing protein [Cyanobacteriota bacterium]
MKSRRSKLKTDSEVIYTPGPSRNTVVAPDGRVLTAPEGWVLLPPGDAALTRRVKLAGEHWAVQVKKGRKIFSKGIWASGITIEQIKAELATERATTGYQKKREADSRRRVKTQAVYVDDFFDAVVAYLNFHPIHFELAKRMARAVTIHATPVGSGTVARTKRIPIEKRAEAAVLAWMRHHTTDYETMKIPHIKGARHDVRKMLAKGSKTLLAKYRQGERIAGGPLEKALLAGSSNLELEN